MDVYLFGYIQCLIFEVTTIIFFDYFNNLIL